MAELGRLALAAGLLAFAAATLYATIPLLREGLRETIRNTVGRLSDLRHRR